MSILIHETEVKYLPFPLLAKQLKDCKKKLSDAIWEEKQEEIDKLKGKIHHIQSLIAAGEIYDIPF